MNKTIGTLRQLFQWLYQEQQKSWSPQRRREKPSPRAEKVWEHLVNRWTPIGQEDIERWFPTSANEIDVDFSSRSLYLYLPPLEKDAEFVPVLSLKCRLDAEKTVMKLRVMLVCRTADDQEGEGEEKLHGIGFRLESPHGEEYKGERDEDEKKEKEGRHDFYHAQIVRDFGWGFFVESPHWLPVTQPSFPLVAECPVTLVLCLLLTLYGKPRSLELIKGNSSLWLWLKPYVGKLQTWIKWKELEGVFM